MKHTEVLKEAGLTNTESITYLTLLKIGPSKSGEIIKKSNLQSSSVYSSLFSLQEKGLVSFSYQGKQKIFQSEDPKKLLSFMEDKKKSISEILPDLQLLESASNNKNSSKVFSGISGIKSALYDILDELKAEEEYYFFQFNQKTLIREEILSIFRNYHLKREEQQIKVKGLASYDTKKSINIIFRDMKLCAIKYVKDFLPTGVIIYKNKVIFLDLEDEINAFVIESHSISSNYKQFFETRYNQI